MEAIYHNLYVGCGIFSVVMLLVTVVLFFALRIYKAFMDLTGISAKRAIREMEEDADYTTRLNKKKQKKTKKGVMTKTGRIDYAGASQAAVPPPQAPQFSAPTDKTEAGNVSETETLNDVQNETQVLTDVADETQVLTEAADETQVLTASVNETQTTENDGFFVVERTILEVHTEETI